LEVQQLTQYILLESNRFLNVKQQSLITLANGIHQGVQKRVQHAKERFLSVQFQVQHQTRNQLSIHHQVLQNQETRLKPQVLFLLDKEVQKVNQIEEKVQFLDPIHVLKRGYSITRMNGKAIDEKSIIELDAHIETETVQGTISAKVTSISRNA
jgi:exodeoxyribonuclease VII large subunit